MRFFGYDSWLGWTEHVADVLLPEVTDDERDVLAEFDRNVLRQMEVDQ